MQLEKPLEKKEIILSAKTKPTSLLQRPRVFRQQAKVPQTTGCQSFELSDSGSVGPGSIEHHWRTLQLNESILS